MPVHRVLGTGLHKVSHRHYLERLALMLESVAGAAVVLGVSRQRVLQLIAAGELEAVKIGKDWFVGTLSLQERLVRHPAVRHAVHSRLSTRPNSAACL